MEYNDLALLKVSVVGWFLGQCDLYGF